MKKINTSPISGTQELLPSLQNEFDRLKNGLLATFHAHGFQSIETPVIERSEILLAKAGGDTEKQIYKVVKTAEDTSSADQALRFDHTVPLARYVVQHESDLTFPFKVTQIGRNFRGERPQKGRFREFYQCDVDVIGRGSLPIYYDAEVIATLADAMEVLPLKQVIIRVSNRKILAGLLEDLGLSDKLTEISGVIDHAEKVAPEKTSAALAEIITDEQKVKQVEGLMRIRGSRQDAIADLRSKFNARQGSMLEEGINELDEVLRLLEERGIKNAVADLLIIRGLDYYTGTVFETIAPDYLEFGSICSGGRYENLASNYTEQKFPGVGGSIGLTRLFAAFRESNLVDPGEAKPIDVCLIPVSNNEIVACEALAKKLRKEGQKVDVVGSDRKVGDKMTYAGKIARFAAVIGDDEVKNGKYELKNLGSGEKTERSF